MSARVQGHDRVEVEVEPVCLEAAGTRHVQDALSLGSHTLAELRQELIIPGMFLQDEAFRSDGQKTAAPVVAESHPPSMGTPGAGWLATAG